MSGTEHVSYKCRLESIMRAEESHEEGQDLRGDYFIVQDLVKQIEGLKRASVVEVGVEEVAVKDQESKSRSKLLQEI